MKEVKTTCAYCGVGCGIIATIDGNKPVKIEGDPEHPANFGKLCSKGYALGETLGHASRLAKPRIGENDIDWATATQAVADGLKNTIEQHGPNSVAFYVSGQLLTEDYYVANKLMKGFIGSANIDTNSRLCMASTVAGHKRAFGADTVPGDYSDLEQADLVVLVGSNLAWCHPVLFQRLKAAKQKRGTKVVVIDPRRTETCDIADLFVPIPLDGDTLLFGGLLAHLSDKELAPTAYTDAHVNGFEAALAAARRSAQCLQDSHEFAGIKQQVSDFYKLFGETEKVVTVFSQGVNQAHDGTDRVNAIINCHLATGRIGRPGMGPFSVTGQPNAMGGREVGGLANMLACHMGFSPQDKEIVSSFWQAPNLAQAEGLRAVDLFEEVHSGDIKAVWIMATNPAVSMPNASRVREALEKCPLVIVSDCVQETDTLSYADIRLPAAGWGEKDGMVTNSDRTLSRQRAFLPLYADARPDWRIICDVAQAMGWQEAFAFETPADIFREYAALTGFKNEGARALDLSGLSQISTRDYDNQKPQKWPVRSGAIDINPNGHRYYADGQFYTADQKANMVAIEYRPGSINPSTDRAFLLNTGRYRDQWHTMTRTGLAAKLNTHRPEPLLDINPSDAKKLSLVDGDFIEVKSDLGAVVVRARITSDQKPNEVFLPMHWSDTHSHTGGIDALVRPILDPVSAQPAFKSTAVAVQQVDMRWRGMLLSRKKFEFSGADYLTRQKLDNCFLSRVAGRRWLSHKQLQECLSALQGEWLEFEDPRKKYFRKALLVNDQLELVLFSGPAVKGISVPWLDQLFTQETLSTSDRQALLAGKPSGPIEDIGDIICSCHGIGQNQIEACVRSLDYVTADQVGQSTLAGTNCGSCVPEINAIIHRKASANAA